MTNPFTSVLKFFRTASIPTSRHTLIQHAADRGYIIRADKVLAEMESLQLANPLSTIREEVNGDILVSLDFKRAYAIVNNGQRVRITDASHVKQLADQVKALLGEPVAPEIKTHRHRSKAERRMCVMADADLILAELSLEDRQRAAARLFDQAIADRAVYGRPAA
jgi:hypothetical protein